MRPVPKRWKQRNPDLIRDALRWIQGLDELARVTLASGVSFVGHPSLRRGFVVLSKDNGLPSDVIRLSKIAAVSRAQHHNPPKRERVVRDKTVPRAGVEPV